MAFRGLWSKLLMRSSTPPPWELGDRGLLLDRAIDVPARQDVLAWDVG